MKIVLVCGNHPNQKTLAHRIHQVLPLEGLILYDPPALSTARVIRPNLVWQKACSVTIGQPLRRAWFGMLQYYEALHAEFPCATTLRCRDVNDAAVLACIDGLRPDLVLVSGTNLLKPALIAVIERHGRVMNLHTGISPYVKGGPSCVNWCLALKEFSLIGNTVMWLDSGIDSGNIVATQRTPLTGSETLLEMQIAVMNHGHALYLECIQRFARCVALPNVPQREFPFSRLFLSKDWTSKNMVAALANYYRYYYPGSPFLDLPHGLRLVDPGEGNGASALS